MIELEADDVFVTIDPDHGGRIEQIEVGTRRGPLGLLQSDPALGPMTWGSFPMAPWAGRVREGRFRFDGEEHRIRVNMPPHSIHGTTFDMEWEVVDAGRDYAELRCPLTWQFGGVAHQHFALTPDGITCVLTVYAQQRAMPAVIGWHPNFAKPASVDLEFEAMYVRDDDYIAVPELVAPKDHPWDDCFVRPRGPLRLHHPDVVVTVESDCDHWVVFDMMPELTAVEPQSGPPDAFTIGGATRLEPGDLLQRTMHISWSGR